MDNLIESLVTVANKLEEIGDMPNVVLYVGSNDLAEPRKLSNFELMDPHVGLLWLAVVVAAVDEEFESRLRFSYTVAPDINSFTGYSFKVTNPDLFSGTTFLHYACLAMKRAKRQNENVILNQFIPVS